MSSNSNISVADARVNLSNIEIVARANSSRHSRRVERALNIMLEVEAQLATVREQCLQAQLATVREQWLQAQLATVREQWLQAQEDANDGEDYYTHAIAHARNQLIAAKAFARTQPKMFREK